MSCLVSLTLCAVLLRFAASCGEKKTFGAGHILDIMLDSEESQELILKINNGVYEYCRTLDLQSSAFSFEEISCKNNIRAWSTFEDYDIEISFVDEEADTFRDLNETEQFDYIESTDDTDLFVSIEGSNDTISLNDTFIHPFYYSYFYSPAMKTLFIFTADKNDSLGLSLAFTKINLITISWNPSGSETETYPLTVADFRVGQQMDITQNYFVNEAAAPSLELLLDGQKWTTYDDVDMFMVRVNSVIDECDDAEWLRYEHVPNVYDVTDFNGSGGFEFDYARKGYVGVDTRISRAYGFTAHSVWYYEVDDDRFGAFRFKDFEFLHSELSSYWAVMWFGVVLLLLCCCCWTIYCCKKKKDKRRRAEEVFGMTPEQEMMTTAV